MTEKGIEEIFKSVFNNFEADVDPNVWTNVQQAINTPAPAPANHGVNSSVTGKAGALAGKLGVKAIIAIVAAATGVSVGAYFLLSDSQGEKIVSPTVQTQQPATVVNDQASSNSTAVEENKIVSKQKVREEKKEATSSPINTSQPQQPLTNSPAPANNITANSATPAIPPAPANPKPAVNTPPAAAQDNGGKPSETAAAPENHTFQNDFADMNDYLEKGVLPNIFTPNGDGNNDEFLVKTKNLKTMMVTVFDKSGRQVYQLNSMDGKWDGNLADGRPAPAGTYYYSVLAETLDGKRCIANSSLTLRR